jgi:hypothetical protein
VTVKRFQFEALIFRKAFGILVSLSSADRAVHSQMLHGAGIFTYKTG